MKNLAKIMDIIILPASAPKTKAERREKKSKLLNDEINM